MLNRSLLFLLISFFVLAEAAAQVSDPGSSKSGSIYSFFGPGYPVDPASIEDNAMGIFGVSFLGFGSAGFGNPAFWGMNMFTAATTGVSFERFEAEDSFTKSKNALINVTSLQLTFPLKPGRIGIGAGIYPVTRSRFRVFEAESILTGPVENQQASMFTANDQGSGGINKLEFGIGFRLNKNIVVGYAPSFVFISSKTESFFDFQDPSIGDQFQTLRLEGQAFGNRFGVVYNKPKFLNEKDNFFFGATLNLPVKINANRQNEFEKVVNGDIEKITVREGVGLGSGDVDLPLEAAAGITYFPSDLFNFSIETQFQQWSEASFDFLPNQEALLKDRYRIGAGFQFHPYTRSRKFFGSFKYSAGVNYDTGHLKINGKNIETLLFSAGLGILSSRSRSTIDLGFQYGVRGTTQNNLVKEDIWAFKISLNLTELMFIRPKLQ